MSFLAITSTFYTMFAKLFRVSFSSTTTAFCLALYNLFNNIEFIFMQACSKMSVHHSEYVMHASHIAKFTRSSLDYFQEFQSRPSPPCGTDSVRVSIENKIRSIIPVNRVHVNFHLCLTSMALSSSRQR